MKLLDFKGYMIPGLYFSNDYCFWIIDWKNNPTKFDNLKEIIVFYPNGRRVCYISPINTKAFFEKYHTVDEVIYADISVKESLNIINISISKDKKSIMNLDIFLKFSFSYLLLNILLLFNKGKKGKTETNMFYHNIPTKITGIKSAGFVYKDIESNELVKPVKEIKFGDSSISMEPVVCHCKHLLEE